MSTQKERGNLKIDETVDIKIVNIFLKKFHLVFVPTILTNTSSTHILVFYDFLNQIPTKMHLRVYILLVCNVNSEFLLFRQAKSAFYYKKFPLEESIPTRWSGLLNYYACVLVITSYRCNVTMGTP